MANPRVIIVDSDEAWLKRIKAMLNKLGYLVVGEATDGPGALKLVRTRYPDLLITQENLPGFSGLEIARIMYEDKLGPVILTTNYLQQDTLEKAKEAKVFSILQKPFAENQLLPVLELALVNNQEITKLEKQIKDLRDTLESRKIVEKAKGILMRSLGLDEEEAFRRIQKQSMNKRVSMRAVAEAIILSYSIN